MPSVELPQGTLNYRDEGDGPVVVLIHGLLVDGTLWSRVAPLLTGHRVVIPDPARSLQRLDRGPTRRRCPA